MIVVVVNSVSFRHENGQRNQFVRRRFILRGNISVPEPHTYYTFTRSPIKKLRAVYKTSGTVQGDDRIERFRVEID